MDGYARKGKHPLSMPQQTAHATPTRIASLGQSMVGSKVRVAGRSALKSESVARLVNVFVYRILSYEPTTGLALLLDGEQGIIIDVSLCIDHNSSSWTRERLSLAMVVGYVETSVSRCDTIPLWRLHGYIDGSSYPHDSSARPCASGGCRSCDSSGAGNGVR